ncbi:MAG: response regulator transcription factor [Bacteroidetes bacterium]|nr:response regulator transcription factor [Bacteroidota bacterium]MBP6402600.1 response regulator transcription factor [Bacteroidia bacterium]MBK6839775.1 response regulator transcription factor [Bacteroidota bacterium]MBK9525844.1 response regulator transcription factor [Bacteroidota bacterium]MBK9543239.1 response regulator transcription factor [Bacteroidota bacterium]
MIKILLADDHSIVRKGLKQILQEEFPEALFEEAADGLELLRKARLFNADIIISDLSMPGRSGMDTLKQLKAELPSTPVIILSIHPEDQYAIRVLKAGAQGYITKEAAPEELVLAVRQVLKGRRYITPSLAEKLAEAIGGHFLDHEMPHQSLSDREFDVLKMISSGKTVSEIAESLSLSVNTISTYRARILEKMNMRTNAELTHYSISNNIIDS